MGRRARTSRRTGCRRVDGGCSACLRPCASVHASERCLPVRASLFREEWLRTLRFCVPFIAITIFFSSCFSLVFAGVCADHFVAAAPLSSSSLHFVFVVALCGLNRSIRLSLPVCRIASMVSSFILICISISFSFFFSPVKTLAGKISLVPTMFLSSVRASVD